MSITKNVILNSYFSMKKKLRKISNDFWHRKLTLKVKFWHFLTPPHYILQFAKFNDILWICWFLAKNLSNFLSLSWKLHHRYCHKYIYLDSKLCWIILKQQEMSINKVIQIFWFSSNTRFSDQKIQNVFFLTQH